MKRKFKAIARVVLVAVMLFSMNIPAFAAKTTIKEVAYKGSFVGGRSRGYICSFDGKGRRNDAITIKNNGDVSLWVVVDGVWNREVLPGTQKTFRKTRNKGYKVYRVKIQYLKTDRLENQNVTIMTNSGSIR